MINVFDILIALSVVGAIALILGILLAIISRFFGVDEDPRLKDIRACLPGVNCGACGYRGCDDYAAAIADGSAAPNLCIPGAEATVAELSVILGVEIEAPDNVAAYVHCNGNCEATTKKASYNGISTCKAASMLYGGPEACRFGCLGLGDCAAVCPSDAICMKDGIAHVDTSVCVGCGVCVAACPKHIISLVPQNARVAVMCNNEEKGAISRKACQNACIACKMCEKACSAGAVKIVNNLAEIDYDKCTGCGECARVCPTGCLKMVYFPDLVEE